MGKRAVTKKKAVKVGIVLLAMVAGGYWIWIASRYVDADAAIARFEAEPSQASADALIRLLDHRRVSEEDGERILKLFMWPEVTTRSSYRLSETPIVSIEHPFVDSPFERSVLMWSETLRRGKYRDSSSPIMWGSVSPPALSESPRLFQFVGPKPESAGTYKMAIEYACSTGGSSYWKYLRDKLLNPGWRISGRTFYRCSFSVPVEIHVAEKAEAEQVGYVSNPELDEAMRGAFTCEPLDISSKYRIRWLHAHATGGAVISYSNIPADIAFKRFLQLPDGRTIAEKPGDSGPIRGRSGESGSFEVLLSHFDVEEVGQYDGILILTPDPNAAYDDPAIKSIWEGELRFPVTFSIEIYE